MIMNLFDTRSFNIHSIIPQPVLRRVNSLFRSQFSTGCDLVLPLSIYSILSFPYGHPVTAYGLFLVFPPLISFNNLF